jgi:hypothetical protein
MSRRFLHVGFLLAAALLAPGVNAWAQRNAVLPAPITDPLNAPRARMADLPPQWIEQLEQMNPGEQERFLSNNERFRRLSAQQKMQIRRRLRAWNSLPFEQRRALLERQQIWEQLPLDQRRQVRETLLPMWQSLPAARRRAVLGKLRELRGLDNSRREARLSDESFLGGLGPDEREMLQDLSNLSVTEAAE